jgi:hypothetical protein
MDARAHLLARKRRRLPDTAETLKKEPVVAKKDSTKALRRFHDSGKRAIEKREERENQDEGVHGTLASLGAKTTPAKNRLMEARRFSALYDDRQLDELCALGQKTGRPLTRSHVLQLIRVADRRQRKALARQCAEESWSVQRLELEVRRLVGRRTYGGRSHEPPQSIDEALVVTERMAASWIRWFDVLSAAETKPKKTSITIGHLPRPIRTSLKKIEKELGELCMVIGAHFDGNKQ